MCYVGAVSMMTKRVKDDVSDLALHGNSGAHVQRWMAAEFGCVCTGR